MKKRVTILLSIFISTTLFADKNWIEIEPTNKTQTKKTDLKTDVNLSQIEPINKIIKNVTVVKQLMDATNKEEKPTDDKNWFLLNNEVSK